jgi:hypothetical protein
LRKLAMNSGRNAIARLVGGGELLLGPQSKIRTIVGHWSLPAPIQRAWCAAVH